MKPLHMTEGVRSAYRRERTGAVAGTRNDDVATAWRHLERAHVLAQPLPVAHVGSHVAQLLLGIRAHDRRQVAGQLVRIVVAGPASLVGRVPTGNTGRAALPLRATAPVSADIAAVSGVAG